MPFEYDRNKSAANKEKHGIDFEEAQALWADPELLLIPARTEDEPRAMGHWPRAWQGLGSGDHDAGRRDTDHFRAPRPSQGGSAV